MYGKSIFDPPSRRQRVKNAIKHLQYPSSIAMASSVLSVMSVMIFGIIFAYYSPNSSGGGGTTLINYTIVSSAIAELSEFAVSFNPNVPFPGTNRFSFPFRAIDFPWLFITPIGNVSITSQCSYIDINIGDGSLSLTKTGSYTGSVLLVINNALTIGSQACTFTLTPIVSGFTGNIPQVRANFYAIAGNVNPDFGATQTSFSFNYTGSIPYVLPLILACDLSSGITTYGTINIFIYMQRYDNN